MNQNINKIAKKVLESLVPEAPVHELARAYLELEKEKARLILHIDDIEKANDNCQTKIANLELEITKLKKSRDVLRKAVEFYGDKKNWSLSDWDYDTILYDDVVRAPLESARVGGIKAREAIKADDEIMGGKL